MTQKGCMDYSISTQNKITCLFLFGRLDGAAQPAFESLQADLLKKCVDEAFFLVVDLYDVTYLDSSGIRLLLALKTKIGQKCSPKISLINARESIQKILAETNLNLIFSIPSHLLHTPQALPGREKKIP